MERFIPVYRLDEDGDLHDEGDGMLLVWALRACSYKTKAKDWAAGHRPPSSSRGFSGLCFALCHAIGHSFVLSA